MVTISMTRKKRKMRCILASLFLLMVLQRRRALRDVKLYETSTVVYQRMLHRPSDLYLIT